jgi:hypothetical protein
VNNTMGRDKTRQYKKSEKLRDCFPNRFILKGILLT